MRKHRVYIDTSVVNQLDAPQTPDRMKDTIALWELFKMGLYYEPVVSDLFYQEVAACPEPKLTFMLEKIAEVDFFRIQRNDETDELAGKYLEYGVLSENHLNDLLHIALATVYQCKTIVSWNFRHFVNYRTMDRVNAVHLIFGYDPIRIAPPSMLTGESKDE